MGYGKIRKLGNKLLSAILIFSLTAGGTVIPAYAAESGELFTDEDVVLSEDSGEESDQALLNAASEDEDIPGEADEDLIEPENGKELVSDYLIDDEAVETEGPKIVCSKEKVTVYYGEDAGAKNANLEKAFAAVLKDEKVSETEKTVAYSFYVKDSKVYDLASEYMAASFDEAADQAVTDMNLLTAISEVESEKLSGIAAGSEVIAVVTVTGEDDAETLYLSKVEVAKRELTLKYAEEALAIDKAAVEDAQIYYVTPDMEEYAGFYLVNDDADFAMAAEISDIKDVIDGSIAIDLTDVAEDSAKAKISAELAGSFARNYYLDDSSFANIVLIDGGDAEDAEEQGEDREEKTPDGEAKVSFSLNPAYIMYGESDDNENGNLDALFAPVYVVAEESVELLSSDADDETEEGADESAEVPAEEADEDSENKDLSFSTAYKFFTDENAIAGITAENFDAQEGVSLSTIPAGTVVYVVAKASAQGQEDVIATDSFTMEKRKLLLHFEAPQESAINEKSELEDEKLVFEKDEAEEYITVEVVENEFNAEGMSTFAVSSDELMPEEIVKGDVTLDVSEVDYEEVGYQEVPMTVELTEDMAANYEIVEGLLGYIYVDETTFTITFTAKNNGQTKVLPYELPQSYLSTDRSIKEVLNYLGVYAEVYPDMGGFVETSKNEVISGWDIVEDAISHTYYEDYLTTDFMYYYSDDPFLLTSRTDYYLTANVCKMASENICIRSSPTVVYNGQAHISAYGDYTSSQYPDLDLSVKYVDDGDPLSDGTTLRYGKDYKVTYKNNINASVEVTDDGNYVPLYTPGIDDAKRPYAIVTGIGNYKGFSAKAYFDIIPADIGDNPVAEITGLKHSYVLGSKGTITGKISPKVTISRYIYNGKKSVLKKYTLKLGKDYEQKLYIYEGGIWKECEDSNPSKITKEGRYLYTVRGKGNYCGTAFGREYPDRFDDGRNGGYMNPSVCDYVGTDVENCQFIVIGDAAQNLDNATISVKKTQLKYKYGTYYTGSDFGITVTVGKGSEKRVLTEGEDYYITYDGVDFDYISGRNSDGVYRIDTSDEIYLGTPSNNARITIANKYDVTITAIAGNKNGIFGSRKTKSVRIKGIKINSGWFKLSSPSLKYDGHSASSGFYYKYKGGMPVSVQKPEYVMSFDYDGYSNYEDVKDTMMYNAVYLGHDAYNKNPGTYTTRVMAMGPGVDHDYVAGIKFKRSGISTKEALSKGILKISCDPGYYNAGGGLPRNIVVTLNGVSTKIGDLRYSGQTFYDINDYYSGMQDYATYVNLTFTVANNKKPGNGATLYVTGDGTVFKGKSGKLTYSINPETFTNYKIEVLRADTYIKEYGSVTQYVPYGGLFAKYEPVAKPSKGALKYKIDLYEAYFKNKDDYLHGRYSLAKINPSQYKLTLTEEGSNSYKVTVENSKAAIITGYDFTNVSIFDNYTAYDKSAAVASATVNYKGVEYNFPADSSKPIPFTGDQIRLNVTSVTLKDGTVLGPDNFYVEYGNNITEGKKSGTFTVILKKNSGGTYEYGGKGKFTFAIGKVDGITF